QVTASGSADIGLLSIEPLIQGYERGLRGKAFYGQYTRQYLFYAVPTDSPIKSFEDFRGKKIGVSSLQSTMLVFTRSLMASLGVPLTDDAFLPVGLGNGALAALQSNQVQILGLWDSIY